MATVDIKVQFTVRAEDGSTIAKISDKERGVGLNEDEAQLSAASLAYGLVEDAWSLVDD